LENAMLGGGGGDLDNDVSGVGGATRVGGTKGGGSAGGGGGMGGGVMREQMDQLRAQVTQLTKEVSDLTLDGDGERKMRMHQIKDAEHGLMNLQDEIRKQKEELVRG
jgi:hypothetical protein